eukprot:Plantae.Rhodophyta-Purpureofilum_apyrenoidigerum.ctg7688.p1 GENE.Plantae.Rhodophyta-Purpureofilum_apyrenoidigerum.ctg7688~~Plantae.Rhodophyta-Purpureofilum_apyrenoidigerum.ctg7688.p1  ORF type:complete len:173 (+),score=16.31 Plantae.Rhodophyta-Purpureofilum_apyrenoidigerum.ctg7688:972-1490(+)
MIKAISTRWCTDRVFTAAPAQLHHIGDEPPSENENPENDVRTELSEEVDQATSDPSQEPPTSESSQENPVATTEPTAEAHETETLESEGQNRGRTLRSGKTYPTYLQCPVMANSDKAGAFLQELQSWTENGVFEEMNQTNVPANANVVSSRATFKRKDTGRLKASTRKQGLR